MGKHWFWLICNTVTWCRINVITTVSIVCYCFVIVSLHFYIFLCNSIFTASKYSLSQNCLHCSVTILQERDINTDKWNSLWVYFVLQNVSDTDLLWYDDLFQITIYYNASTLFLLQIKHVFIHKSLNSDLLIWHLI